MAGQYLVEDKWWVSPYNYVEEVTAEFDLPQKVEIHDATLRDGEQTPGVVFRKDDKIRIAEALDEVGVERIEAGMPAVSEEDFEAIKAISKKGLKAKIFTFARALAVDIDKAIDCGAHGVIVEIPIGYPKLKLELGDGYIKDAKVLRSAPCGNTYYVAFNLKGAPLDAAVAEVVAKYWHSFPCVASMERPPYSAMIAFRAFSWKAISSSESPTNTMVQPHFTVLLRTSLSAPVFAMRCRRWGAKVLM